MCTLHHEYAPGGKLSIIKVSLSIFTKMCGRKGLHSGEARIGFSTTIIHRLIVCSPSGKCLAEFQIPVPPSVDLTPVDFYLFPTVKISLKGKRFISIEHIQANRRLFLTVWRKKISRNVSRSWNTVGICVFSQKGITLMRIHRNRQYVLPFCVF